MTSLITSLKALSPNTVTLGVKALTCKSEGDTIQSMTVVKEKILKGIWPLYDTLLRKNKRGRDDDGRDSYRLCPWDEGIRKAQFSCCTVKEAIYNADRVSCVKGKINK